MPAKQRESAAQSREAFGILTRKFWKLDAELHRGPDGKGITGWSKEERERRIVELERLDSRLR